MTFHPRYGRWLARSKQRQAIMLALQKPLPTGAIHARARTHHPNLHKQDVWFLVLQLMQRKLVVCLTPERRTARIFFLSDLGREVAMRSLAAPVETPPSGINWTSYSRLLRSPNAVAALRAIASPSPPSESGLTIAQIHRALKERRPASFTSIDRSVHDLLRLELVRPSGKTLRGGNTLYSMTDLGNAMIREMDR